MYGYLLTNIAAYLGAAAALRYPLVGLNVYVALAILRPQFIFSFAGDLSGLSFMVGTATLLGWAFKGFGSWKIARGRAIVLPFVLFLGLFVLSSFFALNPDVSFNSMWTLAKMALPFFVGVTLIRSDKDWKPLLWTIVLSQGYVAFEMNLNYLVKGFNTAAEGFGGMDNNFFGVSLVVVLGPAIALMLWARHWVARAAAGLSAALILHTILLTFSRGAMVGVFAVGITLFIVMPKRPTYLAAIALAAIVTVRFTGPELIARYATVFVSEEERDGSAESRLDLWRDCMRVVGDYPLLGVGPANWRVIAASYGWSEGKSAHSVWMETTAEVGVPGGLLLLSVFLGVVVSLWPVARAGLGPESRDDMCLASGVVLSAVGFIVAGQFVSAPGLEPPYYLAMLGAVMLIERAQRVKASSGATAVAPVAQAVRPFPRALPSTRPVVLRRPS